MKKKRTSLKRLAPMPAAAAVLALAATGAHAQTTPVFDYSFPASWGGSLPVLTDLSSAHNNGSYTGGPLLESAVPPGAAAGTESVNTTGGGFYTTADSLLNNTAVAAAGGFTYNIDFMWNGGYSSTGAFGGAQKLIDYAGTESLQIVANNGTSANLQMIFASDGNPPANGDAAAVSTTILPNVWYNVTLAFNTAGNSLDAAGGISGIAGLYVDGSLVDMASAQKGNYGDSFSRPIGVGEWSGDGKYAAYGYNIITFDGDIYNASVDLGAAPVPEPSTLALGVLGGITAMGMMKRFRRRKAGS